MGSIAIPRDDDADDGDDETMLMQQALSRPSARTSASSVYF